MDRNILARNILILNQLEEIASAFSKNNISAVLLKGAALIVSFPAYSGIRNMEDIDMLVRPNDITAAKDTLSSMGYTPAPEDPCGMINPTKPAPVDLSDNMWYLDRKENETLFNESLQFIFDGFSGRLSRLKAEDFYIHVLAHGAIHHAEADPKWKEDLLLIRENWGKSINWREVENKLKLYGFQKAAAIYLSPASGKGSFYGRRCAQGTIRSKAIFPDLFICRLIKN